MDPPLQRTLDAQPPLRLRAAMPELREVPKEPSLLSMLSGVVGKDVAKPMPMPVAMHEPTTDLMKRAEDTEYTELLDEAAELPKGSLERLLRVAAYALSPYSSCHADRTGLPLFGAPNETLEAVWPQKGVRFVAEAVQDNGWSVAGHMEGRRWALAMEDQSRPKLWPTSMDILPFWFLELTFDDGDIYTWQKVTTAANNIVSGKMFVSHRGSLCVRQQAGARTAVLSFKEPGFSDLTTKARRAAGRAVVGHIEEGGQQLPSPTLSGFWDSHLEAAAPGQPPQTLWRKTPLPATNNRFEMPTFVAALSDLPPELRPLLPPTDSRLRPDLQLLQHGLFKQAQEAKEGLEKRMFSRVAAAKKAGEPIRPAWFTRAPGADGVKPGDGIRWRYTGRYWAARQRGFEGCDFPELF